MRDSFFGLWGGGGSFSFAGGRGIAKVRAGERQGGDLPVTQYNATTHLYAQP